MRFSMGNGETIRTKRTTKSSKPMSKKKEGILCIILGLLSAVLIGGIAIYLLTMNKPDDVQMYEARVSNVLYEDKYYKEDSDGKRKLLYDYKVLLAYTVNGEEYLHEYSKKKANTPIDVSDVLYVEVSPQDPTHVYSVSTSSSSSNILLYIILGISVVAGIALCVKGVLTLKKLNEYDSLGYSKMIVDEPNVSVGGDNDEYAN